jgi:hypothetical protein
MKEKTCFRCGKVFKDSDRMLCNSCKSFVTNREEDREKCLWYYSIKKYREKYGLDIQCSICGKSISVLDRIVKVGVRYSTYYHDTCYNKLEFDSSPETISYIFITPNNKKISTFEII